MTFHWMQVVHHCAKITSMNSKIIFHAFISETKLNFWIYFMTTDLSQLADQFPTNLELIFRFSTQEQTIGVMQQFQ